MGVEIERKFLVTGDAWRRGAEGTEIHQAFLSTDPDRIVRVRIAGDRAWLVVKGRAVGISRAEFEYEIPVSDATELLDRCLPGVIHKTRFLADHAAHRWEIDVFHGDNEGLIVAEVELTDPDESIDLPPWIGEEVSHDPRYSNSQLSREPWTTWINHE